MTDLSPAEAERDRLKQAHDEISECYKIMTISHNRCSIERDRLGTALAEAQARIEVMRAAASALIDDWDDRRHGQRETFKTDEHLADGYWSPSAAMIGTAYIAQLRTALAPLNPADEFPDQWIPKGPPR